MSLVAEYESSSESDSGSNAGNGAARSDAQNGAVGNKEHESSNSENCGERNGQNGEEKLQTEVPVKLPSASSVMDKKVSSESSVLANEYKKEEDSKAKALEQHVKMVSNAKTVPVNGKVNGKKVCWMYRRGRCRLGKKCKMYHDSELRETEEKQKAVTETKPVEAPAYTSSPQKRTYEETVTENGEEHGDDGPKNKIHKKKFGLSDNIVPSKKVIQHLQRISQGSQPGH